MVPGFACLRLSARGMARCSIEALTPCIAVRDSYLRLAVPEESS